MSCVRKRGAKWTAQVRVSGWRSFTKTFAKKSDAVLWSNELETRLRAAPYFSFSKYKPAKIGLVDFITYC